jgi:hypothetical protein
MQESAMTSESKHDAQPDENDPEAGTEPEWDGHATEDPAPAVLREDGPARSGSFDPTPYLRQLRGRGGGAEYLDVKWRLLWLRKEHPDAEIITDLVQHDPEMAIFKATVTLPTGGKATGYGSETAADFPDFIEKAETKAVGRALNALGYGAQFSDVPRDDSSSAPAVARASEAPRAARPVPMPQRQPRSAPERAPTPASTRAESATPSPDATEPELAEYSWSAFWPWARQRGLNGPKEVEMLIGQPVAGFSPAQLRDLITAAQARGTRGRREGDEGGTKA